MRSEKSKTACHFFFVYLFLSKCFEMKARNYFKFTPKNLDMIVSVKFKIHLSLQAPQNVKLKWEEISVHVGPVYMHKVPSLWCEFKSDVVFADFMKIIASQNRSS